MAPVPTHLRRIAAAAAVVALLDTANAAPYASPHGGHGVSLAAAEDLPRRIISLVPATTEMLFAMGAGDRTWVTALTLPLLLAYGYPLRPAVRQPVGSAAP